VFDRTVAIGIMSGCGGKERKRKADGTRAPYVTTLSEKDILLVRGGRTNNAGNRWFKALLKEYRAEYVATNHNFAKTRIVEEVMRKIVKQGGRFLCTIGFPKEARELGVPAGVRKAWKEAHPAVAEEKIKQGLRGKEFIRRHKYKLPTSDYTIVCDRGEAESFTIVCNRGESFGTDNAEERSHASISSDPLAGLASRNPQLGGSSIAATDSFAMGQQESLLSQLWNAAKEDAADGAEERSHASMASDPLAGLASRNPQLGGSTSIAATDSFAMRQQEILLRQLLNAAEEDAAPPFAPPAAPVFLQPAPQESELSRLVDEDSFAMGQQEILLRQLWNAAKEDAAPAAPFFLQPAPQESELSRLVDEQLEEIFMEREYKRTVQELQQMQKLQEQKVARLVDEHLEEIFMEREYKRTVQELQQMQKLQEQKVAHLSALSARMMMQGDHRIQEQAATAIQWEQPQPAAVQAIHERGTAPTAFATAQQDIHPTTRMDASLFQIPGGVAQQKSLLASLPLLRLANYSGPAAAGGGGAGGGGLMEPANQQPLLNPQRREDAVRRPGDWTHLLFLPEVEETFTNMNKY